MVKNCNNGNLAMKNIDEKYYLFYQVWKELTETKTLHSYQFRIMNTFSSLKELVLVIDQRLNRYHNSNHNIDECKKETLNIVKNDSVIEEVYPIIWRRLVSHLSEKTDTESQQRVLRYQIEYCYNILREDYFDNLANSLENDISSQNSEKIIKKTNQIVSNCASLGWSMTALHGVIDMLYGSKNEPDKWERFKERIFNNHLEPYHILIPLKVRFNSVPGQSNEDAERRVIEEIIDIGIPVKDNTALMVEYNYIDNKFSNKQKYLLIEISAHDYYSASHKAISRCANILNILSFYNLIEPWNMRDISWYAVNAEQNTFILLKSKDLYSAYGYMDGANRIFRNSKNIDRQEGTSIQIRLKASYSYANMGKASYAQEEKYINTWIALESLCRTDVYDNVISNVLEIVPPALCLRYIYKCYRNFIEDCKRCNISLSFSTSSIEIRHPSKEKIVKDIIALFKDETLYNELLGKCKINNLLYERCKELHKIATDSEVMSNKIERHHSNVKRQLSRLYRIRNEIAHSAMNDETSLIKYIEHLDDYLSSFVSEVVMCAELKSENRIEIVFEIIKNNYQVFCDIKNSKKMIGQAKLLEKVFETGIISLI